MAMAKFEWRTPHMPLDKDIDWECPDCGTYNVDNPSLSGMVLCSWCGQVYDWEQVTNELICSCQLEDGDDH